MKTPKELENEVAVEMADMLAANPMPGKGAVPADETMAHHLAHYFDAACRNLNFQPDEVSARRIYHTVSREIADRRRAADRLNEFLLTSTEDLLEIKREAKRAKR
jgi:hypothetical protein